MTTMNPNTFAYLMWEVVGHKWTRDTDGECTVCKADFDVWRKRVADQQTVTQSDCCKGFVLRDTQEGK